MKLTTSEKTKTHKVEHNERREAEPRLLREARISRTVKKGKAKTNKTPGEPGVHEDKTEWTKGAWGMPWLSEATKDVTSCDKPRGGANIP